MIRAGERDAAADGIGGGEVIGHSNADARDAGRVLFTFACVSGPSDRRELRVQLLGVRDRPLCECGEHRGEQAGDFARCEFCPEHFSECGRVRRQLPADTRSRPSRIARLTRREIDHVRAIEPRVVRRVAGLVSDALESTGGKRERVVAVEL